jgi:hypothetical protein
LKKLLLGILVVLLGLGGWWAWQKLFPGDEVKIRHLLEQTAQAASFGGEQKPLTRLAGAGELAGCFTADVLVKIEALGGYLSAIRGRAQVQQLALSARNQMASLNVRFEGAIIEVAEDGRTATVQLTVIARGSGMQEPLEHPLRMSLRKVDGDWLIAGVESVSVLQRVD